MIRFSQHASSNMCSVVVAPVLMLLRRKAWYGLESSS